MFARQGTGYLFLLLFCSVPFVGAADKPRQQTAQIRLYMPEKPDFLVFDHPEATANFVNYRDAQIAMMRSQLVINAALKRPEIAKLKIVRDQADPVAWIQKELHIDHPDGAEIIRLAITGDNGPELAKVVEAVADVYLKVTEDQDYARRHRKNTELLAMKQEYSDKLKVYLEKRKNALEEVGVADLKAKAYVTELVEREYNASLNRLAQARMTLTDLEFQNRPFLDDVLFISRKAIEEEVAKDPLVQELEKERLTLRVAKLQAGRKPGDPKNDQEVKKLEEQLKQNAEELNKERDEAQKRAEDKAIERAKVQRQSELKSLPFKIDQAKEAVEYWTKAVNIYDSQRKVVHKAPIDDSELASQIEETRKTLALINHEITKLDVEIHDPIRVRFFDDNSEKRGKATIIDK